MLTPTNKSDLRVVLADYRRAIESGNNDRIADTAEALDATMSKMEEEMVVPGPLSTVVVTLVHIAVCCESTETAFAILDAIDQTLAAMG